jgi:hypothetical protein
VAPLSTRQVLLTARIKASGVYIQEDDESHHEHEADDRKPPAPGRWQFGEFGPSLQTPLSVPPRRSATHSTGEPRSRDSERVAGRAPL